MIRGHFAAATALIVAFAISACGDSPTTPPPAVNNTPPTIESVTIAGARVEADRDIVVVASVKDAETPIAQLTFTWSAAPHSGTFTGSGATVTWRAPKGETTPDLYTITLQVTEKFASAGQVAQNSVVASASVHYNDSPAETKALASQFLADFGTFSVSAAQCVRNFSDNCRGKQDELSDIENNRANFHILTSTFTPTPSITFNGDLTAGSVEGPCVFEDIPNSGADAGRRERVSGTCLLTTVYENFRWFLCDSHFANGTVTPLSLLRGRVPGRLIFE